MKLSSLLALGITLAMSIAAAAETLRYHGTIGQQPATLSLEIEDNAVVNASYRYDRGHENLAFAEHRLLGSTLVLADTDGNLFHLHLEHQDGQGTGNLGTAERLQGNMTRGDTLELPVDLLRTR